MNDLKLFRRSSLVESCSTSLPGGDQVDGSPPAASREFWEVFLKKLSFLYSSNQVSDCSGFKHDNADLYVRGSESL